MRRRLLAALAALVLALLGTVILVGYARGADARALQGVQTVSVLVVAEKIRVSKDANYGFNAETEEYEDLVSAGVIDPTKVTRTALQNAASIAALLLTTEALVSEIKEDEKVPAGPPGGGGMGGMY